MSGTEDAAQAATQLRVVLRHDDRMPVIFAELATMTILGSVAHLNFYRLDPHYRPEQGPGSGESSVVFARTAARLVIPIEEAQELAKIIARNMLTATQLRELADEQTQGGPDA